MNVYERLRRFRYNPDMTKEINISASPAISATASATAAAPTTPDIWLASYRAWQHIIEPAFWICQFCLGAIINTAVVQMDIARAHLPIATWEPAVWEWSSHMVILALLPAIFAFEKRFSLCIAAWRVWRKNLLWHLLASIIFCLLHVLVMVIIRKISYQLLGEQYVYGDWPREVFYEYMKDIRTYFGLLIFVAFYRLLLLRLQGEAILLGAPETGAATESIERPERFLVKKLGKEFLLPAADIEWCQAQGNYVNLHIRGRDYPLRSTMAEIEARLDPATFVRVHRSYIVNLNAIESIEPLDSGDARAKTHAGALVPVSRRYRENLRKVAA